MPKINVNRELSALNNLGPTIIKRLGEIGVYSESDLCRIGPIDAYRLMQKNSEKRLPVCYYLYSLEGALQNKHWDDLTEKKKKELLIAIGH